MVIRLYSIWLLLFSNSFLLGQSEIERQRDMVSRLPKIPPGLNKQYRMKNTLHQRIIATYNYQFISSEFSIMRYFVVSPEPPKDHPAQRVKALKFYPDAKPLRDCSILKRPMLVSSRFLKRGDDPHKAHMKMKLAVELYSRELVQAEGERGEVMKLSEEERFKSLVCMQHLDYQNSKFKKWVAENQLKRMPQEGEVDFAKRVYQFLIGHLSYTYVVNQNRILSNVLEEKQTDCAGMSALFTTVMRYNGIPSRLLAGRWAKSSTEGDMLDRVPYYQQHVIAEFYADGVGWVPVDVSSGDGAFMGYDRMKHFGNSLGDFVILHIDTDFILRVTGVKEKVEALMQSPRIQTLGAGSNDNAIVLQSWVVEVK